MAQVGINFTLDAENKAGKALAKAEAQVAKLRRALGKNEKQSKKNVKANRRLKRSYEKLQKSTQRARKGFSMMRGAAIGLGSVFAGGIMIDGIKDAAAFQAKLGSLGPSIDETRARIEDLQRAVDYTFSKQAIVKAESMLRAFGLQEELELTPKILDVISSKAAKMGITTDYALESMIVALARGSAKWLDNLGIIVKASEAQEVYAATLGKTTKELSENEKTIAFVRQALKEMDKDEGKVSDSFKQAAQMSAKLDDAILALKESLVPLAPALVEAIELLAKGAIHVTHFVESMLQALGIIDTATEKALKKYGAEKYINEERIKQTYALLKAMNDLGIGVDALALQEDKGLFQKAVRQSIKQFDDLKGRSDKASKVMVADILAVQNELLGDDSFLSEWNGFLIDLPIAGHLFGAFSDDTREHADLANILGGTYGTIRDVLLDNLSAEQQQTRIAKERFDAYMEWVKAMEAFWIKDIFGDMVPGGVKAKTDDDRKPTGPTWGEKQRDLKILALQLLLEGDLSARERQRIEHQIQQIELDKRRVDRVYNENKHIAATQRLLDAQQGNESNLLTLEEQRHELSIQMLEWEMVLGKVQSDSLKENVEGYIRELKLKQDLIGATVEEAEAITRKAEIEERAQTQTSTARKATLALDLQIMDERINLAGTQGELDRIALERKIEDIQLQKERIGLEGDELRLFERRVELIKKERDAEDLSRQIHYMTKFSQSLSDASANMQEFSPRYAEAIAQAAEITSVWGKAEKKQGEMADATVKGVGTTVAAFVEGEREKALVLAAMEGARAVAAFAIPNWGKGIGHTIAAGMFLKAAGEAGGAAPKKPPAPPSDPGAGSVTVNFGSGIVLGTAVDVGRAVYDSMDAAGQAGMISGKV